MCQGNVVKGMRSIPLSIIPLKLRFLESRKRGDIFIARQFPLEHRGRMMRCFPRALAVLTVVQLIVAVATGPATAKETEAPFLESEFLFPLEALHNHGSCIVELPNGDLLVCWYRGSGERTADDVAVMGARDPGRALQRVREAERISRPTFSPEGLASGNPKKSNR